MFYWVLAVSQKIKGGYVWVWGCVCACVHMCVSKCAAAIIWSNRFLTSCLLALVSAVPERHQPLGGSQTLRRRERGDTHSHTPQRKQVHTSTPTHTFFFPCIHSHINKNSPGLDLGGLTDMCSVWDDQPFLPVFQTYTHSESLNNEAQCAWRPLLTMCMFKTTHLFLCARSSLPLQTALEGGSLHRCLREKKMLLCLSLQSMINWNHVDFWMVLWKDKNTQYHDDCNPNRLLRPTTTNEPNDTEIHRLTNILWAWFLNEILWKTYMPTYMGCS